MKIHSTKFQADKTKLTSMKKILFLLFILLTAKSFAQLKIVNTTLMIQPGGTLTVLGDITSNVAIQGAGLVLLKGSTLQNIDMGTNAIPNLELDNTANATLLNTDTRIANSLVLTNGKLQTGDLNLILGPAGAITGGSTSSFVRINGTGQLKKELTGDVTSFELPVGENANYRPAYLTTSGCSYSNANFGVRVLGTPDPNKPLMAASFLNTSWPVTKTGINGGTLTLAGQYIDPLDIIGTESNLVGYYNNGTDWSSLGETHNTSTNRVSAPITTITGSLSGINKFLLVGARAFLQGAYSTSTGLMTDKLRTLPFGSPTNTGNFPSTDPYRVSPYNAAFQHVNNIGIEGIINAGVVGVQPSPSDNIVDWVFLELRNTGSSPNSVLQTRSALIQKDGDIVDMDGVSPVTFNNLPDGNYVLAVRHRNHLGLRIDQAFPRSINETKSTAFTTNVIDFRTATDAQLFGTSVAFNTATHPVLGTVNLLWGGNANGFSTTGNSTVRGNGGSNPLLNDYLYLFTTVLGGNFNNTISNVYNNADLNMDGTVRANGGSNPAVNDFLFLITAVLVGNINRVIFQQL